MQSCECEHRDFVMSPHDLLQQIKWDWMNDLHCELRGFSFWILHSNQFYLNVGLSVLIQKVSPCPTNITRGAVILSQELCHYSLSSSRICRWHHHSSQALCLSRRDLSQSHWSEKNCKLCTCLKDVSLSVFNKLSLNIFVIAAWWPKYIPWRNSIFKQLFLLVNDL